MLVSCNSTTRHALEFDILYASRRRQTRRVRGTRRRPTRRSWCRARAVRCACRCGICCASCAQSPRAAVTWRRRTRSWPSGRSSRVSSTASASGSFSAWCSCSRSPLWCPRRTTCARSSRRLRAAGDTPKAASPCSGYDTFSELLNLPTNSRRPRDSSSNISLQFCIWLYCISAIICTCLSVEVWPLIMVICWIEEHFWCKW